MSRPTLRHYDKNIRALLVEMAEKVDELTEDHFSHNVSVNHLNTPEMEEVYRRGIQQGAHV